MRKLSVILLSLCFLMVGATAAYAPCSLSGFVYCDDNENDVIDAGDTPLSGVGILMNGNQVAVTDVDGYYFVEAHEFCEGEWTLSLDIATLPSEPTFVNPSNNGVAYSPFMTQHWLIDSPDCHPAEPYCGDGIVNGDNGETCEPPGASFVIEDYVAYCRADCTFCGDGFLDEGEECDDSNNIDGDGCSADCTMEGGGEGCTPGYWKQTQHFDSWENPPYDPETKLFSDVFEDAFPGMTLLEVLKQGGGGLNALGRHTVAALLNAASLGVSYDVTEDGVIEMFNLVYPGGDYEDLKDDFEGFNEQGCPLN